MPYAVITDTVSIYRLTKSGNNQDYGSSPVYSGLQAGIFPAGPDIQAFYGGELSAALYDIYLYVTPDTTIETGDKVISGSKEYIVKGVPQVYSYRNIRFQRLVGEKIV